ncbi:MAG: transaldolase [Chloroflexi bacterium]|nr:transaldolase [Chloroflexota bacterium]
MQLLLDSAVLDEARQAAEWGWVNGATTNPTLLAKSGLPPAETLKELGKLFKGQIFYQLTGDSVERMKQEAGLASDILGEQLVLKIPATELGFRAAVQLSGKYTVAITSLYKPAQALAAHAAGARYALYYHNRAKRLLPDGADIASRLIQALAGTDTEVVAASLKSPEELIESRMAGVPILSAPLNVLAALPNNEHSDAAVEEFRQTGTGLLDHQS